MLLLLLGRHWEVCLIAALLIGLEDVTATELGSLRIWRWKVWKGYQVNIDYSTHSLTHYISSSMLVCCPRFGVTWSPSFFLFFSFLFTTLPPPLWERDRLQVWSLAGGPRTPIVFRLQTQDIAAVDIGWDIMQSGGGRNEWCCGLTCRLQVAGL